MRELASALSGAKRPVFGTVSKPEMLQRSFETVDWAPLSDLDWTNVYDQLSGGYGHTLLNLYDDGLYYTTCYRDVPKRDPSGALVGLIDMRALPYLSVETTEAQTLPSCDPALMKIVRLGAHDDFMKHVGRITAAQPLPAGVDLDGKYVVLASLEGDVGPVPGRNNPEVLAWAVSDLLPPAGAATAATEAGYYEPAPYGDMLLVLIAIFSVLGIVAFAALFMWLRRTRLGTLRFSLPWIAAAGAALVGLALFAGFEIALLALRHIPPQVSLVAISIVVTAGLCGERGRQLLYEQMTSIEAAPEVASDYDVFLSYAHDELPWVFEHVYKPLQDAQLPDGRKLKIFFDTSSIQIGASWQDRISLAIDGSRYIVPVYSDVYFTRPYCRFEIRRAHRKWIARGTDSGCVLPIMHGHAKIDEAVDDIQARSVDDVPDLVAQVIATIVAGLSGGKSQ
jgi:hypothetical protein